jgi:hypothetical protein
MGTERSAAERLRCRWTGPRRLTLVLAPTLLALAAAGCVAQSKLGPRDSPAAQATLPTFPDYGDPVWIRIQGIPLKRSWLREGRTKIKGGEMFVLPYVLTKLPYKNDQETKAWVEYINARYKPKKKWRYRPERRLGHYKCMSTSASTILDWHALRAGRRLGQSRSWQHGGMEGGYDPRVIDSVYFQRAKTDRRYRTIRIYKDPVEGTPIPYHMLSFAIIITAPGRAKPAERANGALVAPDSALPGVTHRLRYADMPKLKYRVLMRFPSQRKVRRNPGRYNKILIDALEHDGPIYMGLRMHYGDSGGVVLKSFIGRLAIRNLSGHGVVIVGYIRQNGRIYFIYREVFGPYDKGWSGGGPAYRLYPVHSVNEAYSFYPVKPGS